MLDYVLEVSIGVNWTSNKNIGDLDMLKLVHLLACHWWSRSRIYERILLCMPKLTKVEIPKAMNDHYSSGALDYRYNDSCADPEWLIRKVVARKGCTTIWDAMIDRISVVSHQPLLLCPEGIIPRVGRTDISITMTYGQRFFSLLFHTTRDHS